MSLTLELSPSIEQQLQDSAAQDGVSAPVLAQRLLTAALRQKKSLEAMQADVAKAYAAMGETEEETEAFINATVKQVRAEMRAQDAQPPATSRA